MDIRSSISKTKISNEILMYHSAHKKNAYIDENVSGGKNENHECRGAWA